MGKIVNLCSKPNCEQTCLFLAMITLTVLCYFIIINREQINDYIKKHKKITGFICAFVVIVIILSLSLNISEKPIKVILFFSSLITLMCVALYLYEINSSDIYMASYCLAIIIYIEAVCLLGCFNKSGIHKFFSNCFMKELDDIAPFLIEVLVFTFFEWFIFYISAKNQKKEKFSIDEIELEFIFLKSVFQSLTASVALSGLISSIKLGQVYQILAFLINAYAAFSYPILDINKYVREKEIKQNGIDKHSVKSKE